MTAIITGDIIDSQNHTASEWLDVLKRYFSKLGTSPKDWEIYRGDEFQLRVSIQSALEVAIHIKALIKINKGIGCANGNRYW